MLTTALTVLLVVWGGSGDDLGESPWNSNYAQALKEARAKDKPLFVVFESGTSEIAQGIQARLFVNEKVERILTDDYVRMFVDVDSEEGQALATQFGCSECPRLVVIDRSGDWQVYRRSGAHTADEVQTLLTKYRRTKLTSSGATLLESGYQGATTYQGSTYQGSSYPVSSASTCKT